MAFGGKKTWLMIMPFFVISVGCTTVSSSPTATALRLRAANTSSPETPVPHQPLFAETCAPDRSQATCQAFYDHACADDPLYCAALAVQPSLERLGDHLLTPLLPICQEDVVVGCGLISQRRFNTARYDGLAESIDQELCLNSRDVQERSLRTPHVGMGDGLISSDDFRRMAQAMSHDACRRLDRTYHSLLSENPNP